MTAGDNKGDSHEYRSRSRSTCSAERRRYQNRNWFRKARKWRTGCRWGISILKHRHGLDRCRYPGFIRMQRWVGLE